MSRVAHANGLRLFSDILQLEVKRRTEKQKFLPISFCWWCLCSRSQHFSLFSRIEVTRHGNVAPEIFLRNVCVQTDSNRIWMAMAKRFATQSRDEFVIRERESENNPAMSQNLKKKFYLQLKIVSLTRINVYFNFI